MTALAAQLEALPGARHVSVADTSTGRPAVVTADLRSEAADPALTMLRALDVPPDDIALVRLDTIAQEGGTSEASALVWADILGQARVQARARTRYLVLMAAAGVIAGLAVVNDSATLIVGAMAISPDLLPVTAACTGIVFRRPKLVRRGLTALIVGLAAAGLFSLIVGTALDQLDLLPQGFDLHEFSAAQTHVNTTTILVALAAGVAGMLAIETRASAAVGVAISVTTIPATAYLGIAAALGQLRTSLSGVAVLAVNVVMMLIGGSAVLAVQRRFGSGGV